MGARAGAQADVTSGEEQLDAFHEQLWSPQPKVIQSPLTFSKTQTKA